MGMDTTGLPFPKGAPRVLAATSKRAAADKALRDAYAVVDARDKGICRATLRTLRKGAPDARMRLERHHLQARGSHPELRHDPRNIVTLCGEVHQLVTAGWIEIEGADANKRLVFRWSRGVPPTTRAQVVLASKRRSQRKDDGDE